MKQPKPRNTNTTCSLLLEDANSELLGLNIQYRRAARARKLERQNGGQHVESSGKEDGRTQVK